MNIKKDISPEDQKKWQVPAMEIPLWQGQQHHFCVVIPVINEGERIKSLLKRMEAEKISSIADIIIVDGGSTDGSLEIEDLKQVGVRGLLIKKGLGKLSAQLRCAYAFALVQGYEGIVTIDGNDKDDPEAIPRFIEALENGIDFVQASRFLPGGVAVNTPKSRDFAIRYIHAPCLSLASGFKWTDTTQGFRAYSRRMLLNPKIALFRDVFSGYELLAYLSYRAPKLGYVCRELPTVRRYPNGEIPSKISVLRGNFSVLKALIKSCLGLYNPRNIKINSTASLVVYVLIITVFSWQTIKTSFFGNLNDYQDYGKQQNSLYSYLNELTPVIDKFPRSGIICYLGFSKTGDSPRKYYLWTLYGLAPRVLIPWGKKVSEEGVGLRTVAPSLLWTSTFDESVCSYILLHQIDKREPLFKSENFTFVEEIISGGTLMSLYKRVE